MNKGKGSSFFGLCFHWEQYRHTGQDSTCTELLRHLASDPKASKASNTPIVVIIKNTPIHFQTPPLPRKRSLPLLRTALLKGPSLLRNNLVILIRIIISYCLWLYLRMQYIKPGGRENREEFTTIWILVSKFPSSLFRAQAKR